MMAVPIGYVTVDKPRLEKIENYLDRLVKGRGQPALAWSENDADINKIMGVAVPITLRQIVGQS